MWRPPNWAYWARQFLEDSMSRNLSLLWENNWRVNSANQTGRATIEENCLGKVAKQSSMLNASSMSEFFRCSSTSSTSSSSKQAPNINVSRLPMLDLLIQSRSSKIALTLEYLYCTWGHWFQKYMQHLNINNILAIQTKCTQTE